MAEIILYSIIFGSTYIGVRHFRFWSLKKNLLDIPNERSSHTMPTPRGGGLIIVIASLSGYLIYNKIYGGDVPEGYFIGALLISLLSWLDDIFTISFVWRFLAHITGAVLIVSTLGGIQEISLPWLGDLDLGIFGKLLTLLWIIWLTNAFNFMDGIDGLAGIQAVTAGIGWLIIGKSAGFQDASVLGGIIAVSSLAFLFENWSPAKIFMGDVGSAFLGFSFAVIPLLAKNERAAENSYSRFLPVIAVTLVWFFLFDTFLTFLRRILKREKVWKAHREHIYQKLVITGCTHQSVATIYGIASAMAALFLIYALRQNTSALKVLVFFIILQTVGITVFLRFREKRRLSINNG